MLLDIGISGNALETLLEMFLIFGWDFFRHAALPPIELPDLIEVKEARFRRVPYAAAEMYWFAFSIIVLV
jgi:hypothetical protein